MFFCFKVSKSLILKIVKNADSVISVIVIFNIKLRLQQLKSNTKLKGIIIMNISKMTIILSIVFTLNASEIEPFGKFKFGDTITPIHEKLCSIEGIKTIKIGFSESITKNDFCISKEHAIEQIVKSAIPKYGPILIQKVKINGFENIARYNLYIRADGININNVDFELILQLGAFREEQTVGSYLLTQNDIIMIQNFYVPLELQRLQLKPKDNKSLEIYKKEIFTILWNKYGYLVNDKKAKEIFQNQNYMNIHAKDNTYLSFNGDGVIYDSENYLNKLRDETLKSYMKDLPKNKNDSSKSL